MGLASSAKKQMSGLTLSPTGHAARLSRMEGMDKIANGDTAGNEVKRG
jgi:hypothetical protein